MTNDPHCAVRSQVRVEGQISVTELANTMPILFAFRGLLRTRGPQLRQGQGYTSCRKSEDVQSSFLLDFADIQVPVYYIKLTQTLIASNIFLALRGNQKRTANEGFIFQIKNKDFSYNKMVNFENLDKSELQKLIIGAVSVLAIYCVSGVLHEYLIVYPYVNRITNEEQILYDRSVLIFVPCLLTWVVGKLYNRTLQKQVIIPEKNTFYCGVVVYISNITYTWAVAKTSFPVVMAFKSCNLLSVLLVAILCTRVKEKSLNLGGNKIIVGFIVSVGVFLFSFFDPEIQDRSSSSQFIGIVFLLISLLADGFLPDFQAEIKAQYKPQPTEMMEHINKWVALISLASIFLSFSATNVFMYLLTHPLFVLHLLGISILSCVGQFVVYYLIKQFKQHIVPFIITLRKILTIGISILFYGHKTSVLQIVGVIMVTLSVCYQFLSQIESKSKKQSLVEKHAEKFELTEENESFIQNKQPKIGYSVIQKGNFEL